jgi:5'-nucleotidase
MIGATLISSLFHDEPSVETLNRIGLEFNAVGNHEFDKGSPDLLRLQRGGCKMDGGKVDANSCQGAKVGTPVPFEGARFQWLSANVVVSATGQTLLPWCEALQGVPVAFIGMTLKDTPGIVVPTGVAGLEFRDEAATVNALVPKLRAEGIEAIVVLVHEGGVQSGLQQDINACEGNLAGSPIAHIVSQLDDAVDVVLSGHTHAAYNCRLPNAKGRAVPVSSAKPSAVLSDIDVRSTPARDISRCSDQPADRPP